MIMRIAAIAAFLAVPAAAQTNCGTTEAVERVLRDRHGEAVVAYGMMQSGSLMQIWANPRNGGFTAVVTNGIISCIAASGNNFATVAMPPNL